MYVEYIHPMESQGFNKKKFSVTTRFKRKVHGYGSMRKGIDQIDMGHMEEDQSRVYER